MTLKPEDRVLIERELVLAILNASHQQPMTSPTAIPDVLNTPQVRAALDAIAARSAGPVSSGEGEPAGYALYNPSTGRYRNALCPTREAAEGIADRRSDNYLLLEARPLYAAPLPALPDEAWKPGDIAYHTVVGIRVEIIEPCEGWWVVKCSAGSTCIVRPSHLADRLPTEEGA